MKIKTRKDFFELVKKEQKTKEEKKFLDFVAKRSIDYALGIAEGAKYGGHIVAVDIYTFEVTVFNYKEFKEKLKEKDFDFLINKMILPVPKDRFEKVISGAIKDHIDDFKYEEK